MKKLTDLPVPTLFESQLEKFTEESIHTERLMSFNVDEAVNELKNHVGKRIIGADFGGDKGVAKLFDVANDGMSTDSEFSQYVQGNGGEGYLECLEEISEFATANGLPVGISWGSPLEGTRPLEHPKISEFSQALNKKYNGDLSDLFPTLGACINDGPAGLISAAIHANTLGKVDAVLLPINGGGLGMAVLKENTIYSTEAGHVEAVAELNTYNQSKPCGVFGQSFTCIETLGANKAGIEAQWTLKRPYLRAIEIEQEYLKGDEYALELYDHSAWVVAHMIVGTSKALNIDLSAQTVAVMGHGGGFKFPQYGDRIKQIIEKHLGNSIRLNVTHEFGQAGSNACIEGAAIAALINSN